MDILTQILLIVLIFAGIWLIAVLWRLFEVLGDIKTVTEITSRRAREIDEGIDRARQTFQSTMEALKGFLLSFDIIKAIKNKFSKGE